MMLNKPFRILSDGEKLILVTFKDDGTWLAYGFDNVLLTSFNFGSISGDPCMDISLEMRAIFKDSLKGDIRKEIDELSHKLRKQIEHDVGGKK